MLPNVDRPYTDDMKCYVLINTDILTPIQIGVQGAHALAELVHGKSNLASVSKWVNIDKTLIFLSANEFQKDRKIIDANLRGLAYASFKEPDIGNVWTATAFEPIPSSVGKEIFGDLPLAK
jgi:hypothetical protein